jgi:hypothetical protein
MNAEDNYISAEGQNIARTIELLDGLLKRTDLSRYEIIALGKLLQDIYTGIERILRAILEQKGVSIKKTENWHKELLLAGKEQSLLTQEQFEGFRALLVFRHMEIHGYGFMLDEQRLRQLAGPVSSLCRNFLKQITNT